MNELRSRATASWRVCDDITYRKVETSSFTDYTSQFRDPTSPTGDLIKPFVAMALCGGPIAFVYKKYGIGQKDSKYTIVIQNLPKNKVKAREFDRGTIVYVDWTINEDLLLVTEDGKYHILDIFQETTNNDRSVTLSESVSTISSACAFKSNQGTGLVALRKNQEGFIAVKNVYNPTIQTISINVDLRTAITTWCVIDHQNITIAYAYENIVVTCCATSAQRDQQSVSSIIHTIVKLVPSSNYQNIAVLKDNGEVLVALKHNIGQPHSFVLKYKSSDDKNKITDIAWSASDTIIGIQASSKNWFDLFIINGKHSEPMTEKSRKAISEESISYTTPIWLSTEADGVRIISGSKLDFFQRVPDELYTVFDILLSTPGSKLYTAYIEHIYENQASEQLLKTLKSSTGVNGFEDAVKQCIMAATNEHDPLIQKLLIKAAKFGCSFLYFDLNNPKVSARAVISTINMSIDVYRSLHIINNLQHINISIPMTYKQLELIGTPLLIDRLLRRNLHDFATSVTKSLHIPPEEGENRILVKWAIKELTSSTSTNEEVIADTIKTRLANTPGIPFIDIINEAFKLKKFVVVRRLLNVKVSLSDQIDMLLKLNDKDEALQKALSCGDNDLALFVLMRIKSSEPLSAYMLRLQKLKSLPLTLHLQCLEEVERNNFHMELIKRNPDERERIAYSHIVQRFTTAITVADQKLELTNASKLLREAKNETVAQLVDEEARLIIKQDELEKKLFNVQLKGLSLVETLEALIINSERDADIMRKDFNLSDKRYWWIKLWAFAKKGAWTQLLEFGKKPISPIGYEPFVDVCIHSQRMDEARRFADRAIYSSKVDDERLPFMFAKVQMVDAAVEAAIKLKSLEAINFIESKCQLNGTNATKIRQAKEKLQDYGDNPLRNVFKLFNRAGRADE